jgi:hypothetical protein
VRIDTSSLLKLTSDLGKINQSAVNTIFAAHLSRQLSFRQHHVVYSYYLAIKELIIGFCSTALFVGAYDSSVRVKDRLSALFLQQVRWDLVHFETF